MRNLKNILFLGAALVGALLPQSVFARGEAIVGYQPLTKIAEGFLPYSETYTLQITLLSPATVNLGVSIENVPAAAQADALNFITLSTTSVPFQTANQAVSVTVSINIPEGYPVGTYAYKLITDGWTPFVDPTAVTDNVGGYINLTVIPGPHSGQPPTVGITLPSAGAVFTHTLGQAAVQVPFSIFGSSAATTPLTDLSLTVDGQPVALSTLTGIGTTDAAGTASIPYTTAGLHTVQATAINSVGSSTATSDFSVQVIVPPPTVTINAPSDGASFDLALGGDPLVVPVALTGHSLQGGVTTLTATLNGTPVNDVSLSGIGQLTANGTGFLSITTPGVYTLGAAVTDPNGQGSTSISFTVNGILPPPTVTILTPDESLVVHRFATDPASVIDYSFVSLTDYGVIESVTLTVDGVVVTPTLTGAGTADVGGIGSFTTITPGAHTIIATVTSNGFVASDSVTIQVVEDPTPPPDEACGAVEWLTPVSLNKTVEGGSTVPVKFRITCDGVDVADPEVVIAVYEIYDNGTSSASVIYPWGNQPTGGTYKYTGNKYHLDYVTGEGVHTYRVEVYRPVTAGSTTLGLLDYRDINTFAKVVCEPQKSCKSKKSDKHCKSNKSDKSKKSDKNDKSKKSDKKSGKSDKSSKSSDKDCKSDKSSTSKSDKSSKSNSSKSDKSSKSSSASSSSSSSSFWAALLSWCWSW